MAILFCLVAKVKADTIVKVHIFGDSHSKACFRFDGSPYDHIFIDNGFEIHFFVHWLGPKTMHSVGRDGLNALNLKKYGVLENDVTVFVFGEIDVRCHIGKQRDHAKRTLEEIIDTLVRNYVKTINQNRAFYRNINCVIVGIVPPTNQTFNAMFPFYGTLEDRVRITRQMNDKLRNVCIQNNIKFLDVYSIYADTDGSLRPSLSDQTVHVGFGQNYPIKKLLIDLLIKI